MTHIVDRRNLDFLLFDTLGVGALFKTEAFAHVDRATVEHILDTAQRLAEQFYLPSAARLDAEPPKLVAGEVKIMPEVEAALRAYADAGLSAQNFPHERGGLQLPSVLAMAVNGVFIAANIGISNYSMLTSAAARLLLAFGSEEQRRLYAAPMIAGRWTGTMCLSEPQAGSSLADITTRAEAVGDGSYRLRGTKMWISGAGHDMTENIVNLVLARLPDGPPGVKGISLFIVPQRLLNSEGEPAIGNNVTLVGLNHKMGQRGTTNAMLNFGETGPTVGYLIGEPHCGLHYMFHMMNEARIGVGHGAAMSGQAGYLYSRAYAQERLQGRRANGKDPTTPQVPLIAHADVRRMLLAQKTQVEGAIALCFYCAMLVDECVAADEEERADLELLLDVLTPIAKSWPSEHCLEANKLAIQVLGGAGYTQDHPVERFYRDNRLNPIHEGTFGIQGIDLLGRKVRLAGGRGLILLVGRIRRTIKDASSVAALSHWSDELSTAIDRLERATVVATSHPDPEIGLANATLYLDAAGTIVIAWLWLWQALVANAAGEHQPERRAFHEAKIAACRYCFGHMLPAACQQLALVERLDDTCLAFTPEQIEA